MARIKGRTPGGREDRWTPTRQPRKREITYPEKGSYRETSPRYGPTGTRGPKPLFQPVWKEVIDNEPFSGHPSQVGAFYTPPIKTQPSGESLVPLTKRYIDSPGGEVIQIGAGLRSEQTADEWMANFNPRLVRTNRYLTPLGMQLASELTGRRTTLEEHLEKTRQNVAPENVLLPPEPWRARYIAAEPANWFQRILGHEDPSTDASAIFDIGHIGMERELGPLSWWDTQRDTELHEFGHHIYEHSSKNNYTIHASAYSLLTRLSQEGLSSLPEVQEVEQAVIDYITLLYETLPEWRFDQEDEASAVVINHALAKGMDVVPKEFINSLSPYISSEPGSGDPGLSGRIADELLGS